MVDLKETDRPLLSHLPQVELNNKVFRYRNVGLTPVYRRTS